MPQHIRNQQQHVRTEESVMKKAEKAYNQLFHSIRMSSKQSMGVWIVVILFLAVLVAAGGHYMRYWTIPKLDGVFQKAAPASHLQYFFF